MTIPRNTFKSPHSDQSFCSTTKQPVEHRETGEGDGFGKVQSEDEFFQVQPLDLWDCSDLIREWGIPE